MKLIVGLGNPGKIYAHNRHNAGFRCLNYFARLHSIRFDRRQCRARVGIGKIRGEKLLLAKPGTFVNLSGNSVACLVHKPQSDEPSVGEDAIVNYVLSDFSPQEEAIIKPVIVKVTEAIGCFLTEGIEAAMSKFN